MKKLLRLTKLLLTAALFGVGQSAWADTETLTLYSQDYQDAEDATSWVSSDATNIPVSLQTVDENKFIRAGWTTNSRYAYTNFFTNRAEAASTFYGAYTTYTLSFDAVLTGASRQPSDFAVMANDHIMPYSAGMNYLQGKNYAAQKNPYLLYLKNNVPSSGDNTESVRQTFYINETDNTVVLPNDGWCTYILDVTATTVTYTIKNKSTSVVLATGSYTIPDGQSNLAQGLFTFLHKASGSGYAGRLDIDNIKITTEIEAGFVAVPTGVITAPDGKNRKFTLSCLTDGATIYYATTDLEIGAAGWKTYTGEVTTDASTIYVYAQKGSDVSEKGSFTTGVGTAITLNAPTFSVTSLAEDGGYYYPIVTISNNQTGLELTPASTTLTYKFNDGSITSSNPYTFTTVGTLEVIVSADGFTSNSATFEIEYPYVKTKTIDLQAITASELSSSWKLMAENTGLQGSWSSPYNGTTYSRYWYDVTEESASRITLVDGLEGWYQNSDGANKSYYIYPGLGLVVPLTTQKDDGTENGGSNYGSNNHAIYLAGGTADQYVTWKYGNNYGKNADKTTVTAGNVSFNLYRYSDILTKVEAYSPAVSVTLPSSGYATFASDYALDFANATGVKAYYATNDVVDDGKINMKLIEGPVPAGTGLFLQKVGEKAVSIPVVASSTTDMSANLLKRGTGAAVKSVEDGVTCYVLANPTSGIGFYKLNTTTGVEVATNKAYLELPASKKASRLAFVFDDGEATGIKNVAPVYAENEDAIYNLSGQRVSQPKKGLYVVGGKKVMIK